MFKIVFFILVCTFLSVFGLGILQYARFDRLLRMFFLQHRSEWEQCGRPIGFFWVPRDVKVEWAGTARTTVFADWTFRMPSWIGENQEAQLAYRHFKKAKRISLLVNMLMVVEIVALFVLALTDVAV